MYTFHIRVHLNCNSFFTLKLECKNKTSSLAADEDELNAGQFVAQDPSGPHLAWH